ncbi:MAG TPA: tetratricopeptide repeat protein [Anaerolineae bacterium]|nr:tetratricopeptide repeat protein [Anaerolineae bacterium]
MDDLISARTRAEELWHEAYSQQLNGELADAMALYQASIEVYSTAEAHTFLGWCYSFLGRYEDAITECLKAIEIDPAFGNPYNDIGVYLIEQDRHRDAIEWLQRATLAPRYEAPHFPWLNLGRVYQKLGPWSEAVRCYRTAIEVEPDYRVAKEALKLLIARMN